MFTALTVFLARETWTGFKVFVGIIGFIQDCCLMFYLGKGM